MLSSNLIVVGTTLHVMMSTQWSPRLTEKPLPNCREGIWRISSSALSGDSAQKTNFLSMAFLGSRVLAAADTFADLNAPIRSPFMFLADGRPAVPPVGAASAVFPRLIAGDGDLTLLWGRDTNTAMRWPLNVTALWTATRSRKGIWSSPQRLIGADQVLWDDLVVGGVAGDKRGRVLAAVSTFGPDGPRLVVVSRQAGRWTTTAFPRTALITSSSATRIAGDSVAVAYSTGLETHVGITPDWGRTWSPFRPVPPRKRGRRVCEGAR